MERQAPWPLGYVYVLLSYVASTFLALVAVCKLAESGYVKKSLFFFHFIRFSLTVYDQSTDIIQAEDVAYVRDNLDYSRVFYDITESTMEDLQNELGNSCWP